MSATKHMYHEYIYVSAIVFEWSGHTYAPDTFQQDLPEGPGEI